MRQIKKTVTVIYNDIELELEGLYSPSVYHEGYPGQGAYFETYHVYVNGVDIISLLFEEVLRELDELAIDKIIEE